MAVAGCTAMDVISILRKKRQPVRSYEVRASGEQEDDHPNAFTRIDVVHVVEGEGIDLEAVRRAIELSATKYCSVGATLSSGSTEIHHAYLVRDDDGGERMAEVIVTGPREGADAPGVRDAGRRGAPDQSHPDRLRLPRRPRHGQQTLDPSRVTPGRPPRRAHHPPVGGRRLRRSPSCSSSSSSAGASPLVGPGHRRAPGRGPPGPSSRPTAASGRTSHPRRSARCSSRRTSRCLNVKTPYIGEIAGTDLYIPYTDGGGPRGRAPRRQERQDRRLLPVRERERHRRPDPGRPGLHEHRQPGRWDERLDRELAGSSVQVAR